MATDETKIVKVEPHRGIVGLADSLENINKHFKMFEELKEKLLNPNDYYQTKKGGKAIGKSGWYKFGVAFNLSTEILEERKEWIDKEKGLFAYHIKLRGIAPNGRYADDVGSCDNTDKDRIGESEHVIRAMATTRAKERVYITLVGAPEKGSDDEQEKDEVKFCTCKDGPKTQLNGTCKECGNYSETWYKQSHASESK